jgi:hypothetical protein
LNKITQFLFIFLLPAVVACNDVKTSKIHDSLEPIEKLKALNYLLLPSEIDLKGPVVYPFNDAYLTQRNEVYENLAKSNITLSNKELDYLTIQQRFPERYFPWPAQIDVLDHALLNTSVGHSETLILEAQKWVEFVKVRLQEATNSNIKLNKMAHADLLHRIELVKTKIDRLSLNKAKFISLLSKLTELEVYVLKYKPRNMLGLRQMPNGVDWYQSKLNYFLGDVKAPDEWLIAVQRELKGINIHEPILINKITDNTLQLELIQSGFNLPQPLLANLVSEFESRLIESKVSGLDWQQGYINYNETFEKLYSKPDTVDANFKLFWLTIAEIDLGIHYQGWGLKQAQHVLNKRFVLNETEVTSLIEFVVFYPGQIMSGVKGLLETKVVK